jgi:hypothetical protein
MRAFGRGKMVECGTSHIKMVECGTSHIKMNV